MRRTWLLLAAPCALAACEREKSFDERFEDARAQTRSMSTGIASEIAEREAAAVAIETSAEPDPVETSRSADPM